MCNIFTMRSCVFAISANPRMHATTMTTILRFYLNTCLYIYYNLYTILLAGGKKTYVHPKHTQSHSELDKCATTTTTATTTTSKHTYTINLFVKLFLQHCASIVSCFCVFSLNNQTTTQLQEPNESAYELL